MKLKQSENQSKVPPKPADTNYINIGPGIYISKDIEEREWPDFKDEE